MKYKINMLEMHDLGLTLEQLSGHDIDHCAKCAVSKFNGSDAYSRKIIDCTFTGCRVWLIKDGKKHERATVVVSMNDYKNGNVAKVANQIAAIQNLIDIHE